MLATSRNTIDETIVTILSKRALASGSELVSAVSQARGFATKQAVYSALRALSLLGVIGKRQGGYFLSRVWVRKITNLVGAARDTKDPVFSMGLGDKVSYRFSSLLACDSFWSHVFSVLLDALPIGRGVFVWNPHEWFAIGNEEVERQVFEGIQASGRRAFYSVGGATSIDRAFRREWANSAVAISTGSGSLFGPTQYVNVFEEHVLEVSISNALARRIDDFYGRGVLNAESRQVFRELVSERSPVRMRIERNPKKARALRRKIGQDFFVPSEVRD